MANSVQNLLKDYLYDYVGSAANLNFFDKVVQFDDDPNSVASSEATFIFAAPPVMNPQTPFKGSITDLIVPIGAVQQYSLQIGKQIIPFSELGSCLKRHVAGVGMYSASFSKVLTKHSDLKYAFYSWLNPFLKAHYGGDTELSLAVLPAAKDTTDTANISIQRQYVGSESELFKIPFGIVAVTGTASGEVVNMTYLERCHYQGGGVGVTAGNTMIVPSASITVTRPLPFANKKGQPLVSKASVTLNSSKTAFKLV